jgi:hypothetical protein
MEYLDFVVRVGPGDGPMYPVSAACPPLGEGRGTCHLSDAATEAAALRTALLASRNLARPAPSAPAAGPRADLARRLGERLFGALMTGTVRDLYERAQNEAEHHGQELRLKLILDGQALQALPWEFLYDPRPGQGFLCLSNKSIVRYLELVQRIQPLAVHPPLRILALAAAPSDLPPLDIAGERQRMEAALAGLIRAGQVELSWVPGQTWRDLQEAVEHGPWHIFHFIGHGDFDPARGEGVLALADDTGARHPLGAADLVGLLTPPGRPRATRLVLLNCCDGAESGAGDPFSSAAATLLSRGIPVVLAMQLPISDRSAIELSRAFYEAVAEGQPVDAAVTLMRRAQKLVDPGAVEWGTAVLHMRAADGRIFEVSGEVTGAGAGLADPHPVTSPPVAEALQPGREVLVDMSHGQGTWNLLWNTLSLLAPDVGAIRSGLLQEREAIHRCRVLVVPPPSCSLFTPEEIAYVAGWVRAGGGLFVLGYYAADSHHLGNPSALLSAFGMRFGDDLVMPHGRPPEDCFNQVNSLKPELAVTAPIVPGRHVFLAGVKELAFLSLCSVDVSAVPVPEQHGVLFAQPGSDILRPVGHRERDGFLRTILRWDLDRRSWTPVLAAIAHGKGRVVAAGTWKLCTLDHRDNRRLVQNILRWLRGS